MPSYPMSGTSKRYGHTGLDRGACWPMMCSSIQKEYWWKNILKNNKLNDAKHDEFQISFSVENVDKIADEIKNIESNTKKTFDESNTLEVEDD